MIFRIGFVLLVIIPYTVLLLPVQIVILALDLKGSGLLPQGFHRLMAAMLGLKISVHGVPVAGRPVLFVANHISWMDIPAIGAVTPLSFVAKSDIARWPLVGWMARLQRTIFVDRRRRRDSRRTGSAMALRMADNQAVLLFAEGTSGLGAHVLPFRSALVGAVQEAMAQSGADELTLQPVTIAYTHLHGLPVGRNERSMIAWVGDMGAGENLLEILRWGTKSVSIAFGEPLTLTPRSNRKALTRLAEIKVREMLVALNRRQRLPVIAGSV